MQVGRNEWHTRVYLWWYDHKYNGGHNYGPNKPSTNLCPYMRAVMLWAPIRALFWDWITLFSIGTIDVPLNAIFIPILMYSLPQPLGWLSYKLKLIMWGFTLMSTVLFLVIWGAISLKEWIDDVAARRSQASWERERSMTWEQREAEMRRLTEILQQRRARKANRFKRLKRFGSLVQALLRTGHDRICPEVQIVEHVDEGEAQ